MTNPIYQIVYWALSLIILTINVFFASRSAINAIKIGRKLNEEQQKDNAKRNLFFTLFSYRGSPLNQNFVDGLNRIDVVFHDNENVLNAWRTHYNSLQIKEQANAAETWKLQRTELLSQMALVLGYGSLKQIDISRSYYPEGHDNQYQADLDLRQAALDFLKNGSIVYELLIEQSNKTVQENIQPNKPL